jgi:hypothetical protein
MKHPFDLLMKATKKWRDSEKIVIERPRPLSIYHGRNPACSGIVFLRLSSASIMSFFRTRLLSEAFEL